MEDLQTLRARVNRIQLQLNEATNTLAANQSPRLGSPLTSFQPIPVTTAPSVVNQIRNGEFGHSVNTWLEAAPKPTADEGKECAYWFSNTFPSVGQVLDCTTTALSSSTNVTLKAFLNDGGVHSTYNATLCDWDRAKGQARITGGTSLDALFPNNRLVTPTRAVEYFGCLVALKDDKIRIPDGCRFFCGIWDNTAGAFRPDWIKGTPFSVTAEIRGTPSSATERRYKVFAFTDRGFTYLSSEVTVASAPSDAGFSTADVLLTWRTIPGILQYTVYRFDVVAGQYQKLRESILGGSYIDNGSVLESNVGGYPAATSNTPIAYTATSIVIHADGSVDNDLSSLPIDGDTWVSLTLNPAIPPDYDQSATTAAQVLRIGLTEPLDRVETGITSTATTTITKSGGFSTLDNGRNAILSDSTHSYEAIITYVNDNTVTMAGAGPSWSATDNELYIFQGGDHGLLLDAAHISYVPGAAFAPYPDDLNRAQNGGQNPIAAPSSSTQGGAGGGGGGRTGDPGGGGLGCITLDCPITVWNGNILETLTERAIHIGEALFSGDLRANQVVRKNLTKTTNLQLVRIRASWLYDVEVPCSPGHPLITSNLDSRGRAVESLRRDDYTLISINGHVKRNRIREIVNTGQSQFVWTPSLAPGNIYSAGCVYYRFRVIAWVLKLFGWREPVVGALAHNLKPIE